MRKNWLSTRIFKFFDDIVDHCYYAWNTSSIRSFDPTARRLHFLAEAGVTRRACWSSAPPPRPMALTKLVNLWPASRIDELIVSWSSDLAVLWFVRTAVVTTV